MAAGQGFKTFTTGEVLTAADVNGYLMQGVGVFTDAANRDAEITSPQEGQFAYLKDTNVTTYYTGSAWANLDTTGMTNPMTTTGDTIYSSSGSTPARLGIGSTGQVLTVSGGVPVWSTAAAAIPANDTATVATAQNTTSTTYTDLTTAGPAVTVTTGTKALVIVSCLMSTGDTNVVSYMSYAVSGATTIAASDTVALQLKQNNSGSYIGIRASAASVATLTAGSNTFTAKYRLSADTDDSFSNRSIFVINLA